MKGQEIDFHNKILAIYDLFPETEVLSGNSVLDLVFIPGCMSTVVCQAALLFLIFYGMSLSFSGFFLSSLHDAVGVIPLNQTAVVCCQ